jgi:hypothetical protein
MSEKMLYGTLDRIRKALCRVWIVRTTYLLGYLYIFTFIGYAYFVAGLEGYIAYLPCSAGLLLLTDSLPHFNQELEMSHSRYQDE